MDDSDVKINWQRQMARMLEEQAKMESELLKMKEANAKYQEDIQAYKDNAAKQEVRFEEICKSLESLKALAEQSAIHQTRGRDQRPEGSSDRYDYDTDHFPLAQKTPYKYPYEAAASTRYGQVDMSFTMSPPVLDTPHLSAVPLATSTQARPDSKHDARDILGGTPQKGCTSDYQHHYRCSDDENYRAPPPRSNNNTAQQWDYQKDSQGTPQNQGAPSHPLPKGAQV